MLCCIALFYTQTKEKLHSVMGKKFEGAIWKIWLRDSVEIVGGGGIKKLQIVILETCVSFNQHLWHLACQQTSYSQPSSIKFQKQIESHQIKHIFLKVS